MAEQLWNVWNLPSILTDYKSRSRALQISEHLDSYDIVILNEAFVNHKTLLCKATHAWRYAPPRPWLNFVNSGLLFLSKHEILQQGWERYSSTVKIDRLAAKGIGFVTVNIERDGVQYGKVQVFGTHMQAGDSPPTQGARKAQANQAAAFINQKKDPDLAALILTGDLNMGPRQDASCESFSVHYSSREDALGRCGAYELLRTSTGLREVNCEQQKDYDAEICRFLVNCTGNDCCALRYEGLQGSNGERLSDTSPMLLTLTLPAS